LPHGAKAGIVAMEPTPPWKKAGKEEAMPTLSGDSASAGIPGVFGENTAGGDGVSGKGTRGVVGISDAYPVVPIFGGGATFSTAAGVFCAVIREGLA
jgi:hypothetical protein